MENKTKIAIKLLEKFEDGKLVEKFYVIEKKSENAYIFGERVSLSEQEFKKFKKVFNDFISKQK